MNETMHEALTAPDQSEVFSFLNDAKTFGAAGFIRRIDTHGAVVFLVGDDAYKVKRAVRFPFMDFRPSRSVASLAKRKYP
jgi:hypothetical protein